MLLNLKTLLGKLLHWCRMEKRKQETLLPRIPPPPPPPAHSPVFPDVPLLSESARSVTACWHAQQPSYLCQAAISLFSTGRGQRGTPPVCSAGWEVKLPVGCFDLIASAMGAACTRLSRGAWDAAAAFLLRERQTTTAMFLVAPGHTCCTVNTEFFKLLFPHFICHFRNLASARSGSSNKLLHTQTNRLAMEKHC